MLSIDYEQIASIIKDVAQEKIVPRFRQLEQGQIRHKSSPTDLVTIADEEAEIELTRILGGLIPGSLVLGEEAVSNGAVFRDILLDPASTVWIVDPVDGTGNFANGNPVFGTMVSLVHKGERVGAWIYQIPKRKMIIAEKSAGIKVDGAPYVPEERFTTDTPLKDIRGFVGKKFIPAPMRPLIEKATEGMKNTSTYMCCAFEYVDVLDGKADFSFYKRIEPWDHFAGALIMQEAGFVTRHWDGSEYTSANLEGGLINASSPDLWERIYETFLRPFGIAKRV